MQTVYDWLTMAIFAGLIVLFLQRSQGEERDSLWHYLVAMGGCAVTNWLGNKGVDTGEVAWHVGAVAAIGATIAFIVHFLGPFGQQRD